MADLLTSSPVLKRLVIEYLGESEAVCEELLDSIKGHEGLRDLYLNFPILEVVRWAGAAEVNSKVQRVILTPRDSVEAVGLRLSQDPRHY